MSRLNWRDDVLTIDKTIVGSVEKDVSDLFWFAYGCMDDWRDTPLGSFPNERIPVSLAHDQPVSEYLERKPRKETKAMQVENGLMAAMSNLRVALLQTPQGMCADYLRAAYSALEKAYAAESRYVWALKAYGNKSNWDHNFEGKPLWVGPGEHGFDLSREVYSQWDSELAKKLNPAPEAKNA